MSAIAQLDADVVVIVDSDIALIRPLTVDDFVKSGAVRFYRSPRPLTPDLTRHFLLARVRATLTRDGAG